MNIKLYCPSLISLVVTSAALSACSAISNPTDLYGDPAPVTAAQRTIVITPDTKHVNVEGGEIVRFVVDDKDFAWDFFVGLTVRNFDLREVAPPGMLDHPVTAYISADPRYTGNM
jgi:hypothetical protein